MTTVGQGGFSGLLGDAYGAIAQNGYGAGAPRPASAGDLSPTGLQQTAMPTPAQAAYDLGAAYALGEQKMQAGQIPAAPAGMSLTDQQARLVAWGLVGASSTVRQAVAGLIPPQGQVGFDYGTKETGSSVGVLIVGLGLAALGLVWLTRK